MNIIELLFKTGTKLIINKNFNPRAFKDSIIEEKKESLAKRLLSFAKLEYDPQKKYEVNLYERSVIFRQIINGDSKNIVIYTIQHFNENKENERIRVTEKRTKITQVPSLFIHDQDDTIEQTEETTKVTTFSISTQHIRKLLIIQCSTTSYIYVGNKDDGGFDDRYEDHYGSSSLTSSHSKNSIAVPPGYKLSMGYPNESMTVDTTTKEGKTPYKLGVHPSMRPQSGKQNPNS